MSKCESLNRYIDKCIKNELFEFTVKKRKAVSTSFQINLVIILMYLSYG